MAHTFKYFLLITGLIGLTGCSSKKIPTSPDTGDINPEVYVAIGTEGTAGYSNDALHPEGQQYTYASIIAQQMTGDMPYFFNVPLLSESSKGINLLGLTRLVLGYKTDCTGTTSLSPVREALSGDMNDLTNSIYSTQGPFNNLGVPGLSILDVRSTGYGNSANGAGNYNPWYSRIASNPAASSILQDASARTPTFYTLYLGDADIMTYATSGGTGAAIPPVSGVAGVGFEGSLEEIIMNLSANGATGAISNIPDLLDAPYFTLVPWNGLVLDSNQTVTINSVFNPLGISFQEGANGFTMEDASEPFGVRKMVDGELICLSIPLDSLKCYGMGSVVPIPDKYVLSLDEIAEIQNKIDGYNSVITTLASNYHLALADTRGLYKDVAAGKVYNGVSVDAEFVTGGFFSLDGRNLTPLGQALLANTFIKSMNETFNARIPYASLTQYVGLKFP